MYQTKEPKITTQSLLVIFLKLINKKLINLLVTQTLIRNNIQLSKEYLHEEVALYEKCSSE